MLEPYANPGRREPWRCRDLAAQGFVRLCGGDRRISFSTSASPIATRDARAHRARRHRQRACRKSWPRSERLIPGTHLIRYGLGDWNDSLQPLDPAHARPAGQLLDRLACFSSRWGAMRPSRARGSRPGRPGSSTFAECRPRRFSPLSVSGRHRCRLRALRAGHDRLELLLHPRDTRTGLPLPDPAMTRHHWRTFFSREARRHLALIRRAPAWPGRRRLMDRPATYQAGRTFFRRAESAAFFGREIGLMYVHAHLPLRRDDGRPWRGRRPLGSDPGHESPRRHGESRTRRAQAAQRYFSSSDAAFYDRYEASANGTASPPEESTSRAAGASTRAARGFLSGCSWTSHSACNGSTER